MQDLSGHLHLYHDRSGRMTLDQFMDYQASRHLAHGEQDVHSLGFREGATWAAAVLVNPGAERVTRWLFINWPIQASYTLHVARAGGDVQVMRSGIRVPLEDRAFASGQAIFPLTLEPGEAARLFLRIAGPQPHLVNLQAWEPGALLDELNSRMASKYLLGGMTLVVVVFSVFAWQESRRPGMLALIPGQAFNILTLMGLDGLLFGLAPAGDEDWTVRFILGAYLLSVSCYAYFARAFLGLDRHLPRGDRLLQAAAWLSGLVAAWHVLVAPVPPWMSAAALPVSLVLSALAAVAAWRGVPRARGFLAAWCIFLVGSSLSYLEVFGILSGSDFLGPLTMLGPGAMAVALSFVIYRDMLATRRQAEAVRASARRREQGERSRLEQAVEARTLELRQALSQAEAANLSKSVFLSSMGHELRTPLHTVLGYSALLKDEAAPEARAKVEIIERNGRRLLRLIDDLLLFGRGEPAPVAIEPRATRLAAFLDELGEQGARMAGASGNGFELARPAALPEWVEMDEPRLMQVLLNLLGNACKYTREGKVRLAVERADAPEGQGHDVRLRFCVEDDGPGIAPEDQARVFEPFVRLPEAEARPGLGLGLGIARHWVLAMGGDLRLESALGHGSRFSFTLTLTEVPAPGRHGGTEEPLAPGPADAGEEEGVPAAPILAELRALLDQGRLPALRRRAAQLSEEWPEWRGFLHRVRAACVRIDPAALQTLLASPDRRERPAHPPAEAVGPGRGGPG